MSTDPMTALSNAFEEARCVSLLNESTRAENARRRAHNASGKARRQPLLPLPHHVSPESAALLKAERDALRKLTQRSPMQWGDVVMALRASIRSAVASVVWWDYFSLRNSAPRNRWDHLDTLLQPSAAPDSEVVTGLIAVGYTPWQATRRVTGLGDTL